MSRYAALVLFLSFGIVSKLSHGIEVNVTKDGKLCLYANLMLNFSASYEGKNNKTETVKFELPDDADAGASKCDSTASTLLLRFGEGHSWSVDFSLNGKIYQADRMTFTYNLSDSTVFPNSLLNGTHNVTVKPEIINVGLDTCYSCKSKETIEAATVNMTLWNVLMQAFVVNGSKSVTLTSCPADHMTTVSPTTHVTSTTPVVPVTNTTASAPTTTTTPAPTLPPPTTGNYTLKPDDNSTACLLATFGLRVGFEQGGKYQEMNLDPNVTKATGICGLESSELVLVSSAMTVHFTFTNDTKKFRLHALNITANTSSGVFSAANTNLSLWEAALSSSYMCNKEQNYTITSLLSLYVFNLQVQPFGVKKGVFSTAHECSLDDTSILIPIIVGAALAGLILIVVIAYVIGRRKTYVGYQTL